MNQKKKSMFVSVVTLVVIVGTVVVLSFGSFGFLVPRAPAPDETSTVPNGELRIEDKTVGGGTEAKTGDQVMVNYLGTFASGAKFDSSYDRNEPFTFTLGKGEVIQGWDLGVVGMKEGGKRRLTIPPALAYGEAGTAGGQIPPQSTLIFEVELLKVTPTGN